MTSSNFSQIVAELVVLVKAFGKLLWYCMCRAVETLFLFVVSVHDYLRPFVLKGIERATYNVSISVIISIVLHGLLLYVIFYTGLIMNNDNNDFVESFVVIDSVELGQENNINIKSIAPAGKEMKYGGSNAGSAGLDDIMSQKPKHKDQKKNIDGEEKDSDKKPQESVETARSDAADDQSKDSQNMGMIFESSEDKKKAPEPKKKQHIAKHINLQAVKHVGIHAPPPPITKKGAAVDNGDISSILRSLNSQTTDISSKKDPDGVRGLGRAKFNPENKTTMELSSYIKRRFESCWSAPVGSNLSDGMIVTVDVKLHKDGSLQSVEIVSNNKSFIGNRAFNVFANSAVNAVHKCMPMSELVQYDYEQWSEITLTFNPKELM